MGMEIQARTLGELTLQLRRALEGVREARRKATHVPLGVDVSDYSDEWCHGFLAGQANAFDYCERLAQRVDANAEAALTTLAERIEELEREREQQVSLSAERAALLTRYAQRAEAAEARIEELERVRGVRRSARAIPGSLLRGAGMRLHWWGLRWPWSWRFYYIRRAKWGPFGEVMLGFVSVTWPMADQEEQGDG